MLRQRINIWIYIYRKVFLIFQYKSNDIFQFLRNLDLKFYQSLWVLQQRHKSGDETASYQYHTKIEGKREHNFKIV